MRNCDYSSEIKAGVPQGDALSMLLFCICINGVLEKLEALGYKVVAYADDIIIGFLRSI